MDWVKFAVVGGTVLAIEVWKRGFGRKDGRHEISAQIGDVVVGGLYEVRGGQVHVTCDRGEASAPLPDD